MATRVMVTARASLSYAVLSVRISWRWVQVGEWMRRCGTCVFGSAMCIILLRYERYARDALEVQTALTWALTRPGMQCARAREDSLADERA